MVQVVVELLAGGVKAVVDYIEGLYVFMRFPSAILSWYTLLGGLFSAVFSTILIVIAIRLVAKFL